MREELLAGTFPFGRFKVFEIRDPKLRRIHAPGFRERVAHHALAAVVGPVLDRSLVADTFACRPGKGVLAAVQRAREHTRRHRWYVKIDIAGYFDRIDHAVLSAALRRRFKSAALIGTCDRVIESYSTQPGRGLPIGALTSQHFASYYLAPADRLILEAIRARGMVRYMDDIVWWCDDAAQARSSLRRVETFIADELRLSLKAPSVIQRSERGLGFCGFRILPEQLRLSRRRQQRYMAARVAWEGAYLRGWIDARALQRGYASVRAITAHADANEWRRAELARDPGVIEA